MRFQCTCIPTIFTLRSHLNRAQANQQRLSARGLPHAPNSTTAVATPLDAHSVITIAQLAVEASVSLAYIDLRTIWTRNRITDRTTFAAQRLACSTLRLKCPYQMTSKSSAYWNVQGASRKNVPKNYRNLIAPSSERRPHWCLGNPLYSFWLYLSRPPNAIHTQNSSITNTTYLQMYLPSRSHWRKWFHNCPHLRGSGGEIDHHASSAYIPNNLREG